MIRAVHRLLGALLALLLTVAPALATDELLDMLSAVPLPATEFRPDRIMFAFSRLDRLAGHAAQAEKPGETRFGNAQGSQAFGYSLMGRSRDASHWPGVVGFDLDAVDAALFALPEPNETPWMIVLGGALRLYDGSAIGQALSARGFVPLTLEGGVAWARGEDEAVNPARREPLDPFGRGLGAAQRVGVLDDTVIVANSTALLRRAASAYRDGDGLVAVPQVEAVVQALDSDGDAPLVEAVGFTPFFHVPPELDAAGQPAAPSAALPPYAFGAVGWARHPDGRRLDRIALAYPTAAAAEAAAAVLRARMGALEAGDRRLGVSGVETLLFDPISEIHPVVLQVTAADPGAAAGPMQRWLADLFGRKPVPFSLGVVAETDWAR